jgi:lipopolysaccharide transport system permease protein
MYALVLSAVLSAKLPGIDNRFAYAIYLTSGILAWSLFSELVSRCLTIFIENGNLMKKMAFPKICLPVIVSGSTVFNNTLLFLTIVVIFALLGHLPGVTLLWVPVLMLITLALAMGLGMILGILNVFMRDIGQLVPIILQFSFWLTPIVYPISIIPEAYRGWLTINPLYHVVLGYQNILVYHKAPEWQGLLIVAMISIALLFVALVMFRKASEEMVDAL